MAFSPSYDEPQEFFGAGYSSDSTGITLTYADAITEVDQTEADTTGSGDVRKVIYGIAELLFTKYQALAAADKPSKMTISRSTSEDVSASEFVRTYTIQLRLNAPSFEVADEPS